MLLLCPVRPAASALDEPEISARSAVVMGRDGSLVFALEPDERRAVASTTKIMTALLVIENCDLSEEVEIRAECCGIEGSSAYLKAGERCTVRELLLGLLLVSGNDAAAALACHCAGSEEAFVARMNEKASELGMTNTHFANPHGLSAEDHYSTARDMAKLMLAAMEQPVFAELIALRSADAGGRTWINHNRLLDRCEGCLGGKTGFTKAAGRCLVSCVERDGTRFVCVTLSAPDDWNDQLRLYDWAFARFEERVVSVDELGFSVPVFGGSEKSVPVRVTEPIRVLVPRGSALTVQAELPYFVFAPVAMGSPAGRLSVSVDGQLLCSRTLVYGRSVFVSLR